MKPRRKMRRWKFGEQPKLERVIWTSEGKGAGWYVILPSGKRVPVEIREVAPKEGT